MKRIFYHYPIFLFFIFLVMPLFSVEQFLRYHNGNFNVDFDCNAILEGFYSKDANYFSGNPKDQDFFARSTWNFTANMLHGDSCKSRITLRNKAIWGTTRSVETTKESVRLLDVTLPEHTHGFNRLVPWFREAWFSFNINQAFDVHADLQHYFKMGIFPFQLGRGIALGNAYLITPGILGFFSENAIDQYAWGALWHGDLSDRYHFSYDVYGSIYENLSTSLCETTQRVNENCLQCARVYRGFGKINGILAGRCFFEFFKNNLAGSLTLEPYLVCNLAPMQFIEFPEDSRARLVTGGVAVEYNGPRFECGFEIAVNMGGQTAKAWDRNQILVQRNDVGALSEIYSQVYSDRSLKNRAVVTDANKIIVDTDKQKGAVFNGKEIGASGLYNSEHRFRTSIYSRFNGFMAVADAAYWLKPEQLKVAIAGGYASGDHHPHEVLEYPVDAEVDGLFSGFIGIQELYSGTRVQSLFAIGDQGTALPLSAPVLPISQDYQHYAMNVHGFSNIIYCGASMRWTPQGHRKQLTVYPNILYYWIDEPMSAYHLACCGRCPSYDLPYDARRALGLEVNTFIDVQWLESVKGFLAMGFFVPGQHFVDIIGRPENVEQYEEVTRRDRCGIDYKSYPLINDKVAWVVNGGFFIQF